MSRKQHRVRQKQARRQRKTETQEETLVIRDELTGDRVDAIFAHDLKLVPPYGVPIRWRGEAHPGTRIDKTDES